MFALTVLSPFLSMSAAKAKPPPQSCDTFVVIAGDGVGHTVFGKNSDRPSTEAHEVWRASMCVHVFSLFCFFSLNLPHSSTGCAISTCKKCWRVRAAMPVPQNSPGVCTASISHTKHSVRVFLCLYVHIWPTSTSLLACLRLRWWVRVCM